MSRQGTEGFMVDCDLGDGLPARLRLGIPREESSICRYSSRFTDSWAIVPMFGLAIMTFPDVPPNGNLIFRNFFAKLRRIAI